jgi:hypothetical protein
LTAEENRAEVNFELVKWLAEREQRDWTYFPRLRHEREKRLRDPQDVLIEAGRLRQQLKKRWVRRTRNSATIAHRSPCAVANPGSLWKADVEQRESAGDQVDDVKVDYG